MSIVEIDADLKAFWQTYRLAPIQIRFSTHDMLSLARTILHGRAQAGRSFLSKLRSPAGGPKSGPGGTA